MLGLFIVSFLIAVAAGLFLNIQGLYGIEAYPYYVPLIIGCLFFPRKGFLIGVMTVLTYIAMAFSIELFLGTLSQWNGVLSNAAIMIVVAVILTLIRRNDLMFEQLHSNPDIHFIVHDFNDGDIYRSPSFSSMFFEDRHSHSKSEGLEQLIPKEQIHSFNAMLSLVNNRQNANGVFWLRTRKNEEMAAFLRLIPLIRWNSVEGYQAIIENVTDLQRYEKSLADELVVKRVLLSEVNSRATKNMSIIKDLVNGYFIDSEGSINSDLQELDNWINTINLIHHTNYDFKTERTVNLKRVIGQIVSYIIKSYGGEKRVKVKMRIQDVPLSYERTMDLGLILNELTVNSMKHAFSDRRRGRIIISIVNKDDEAILSFRDDGVGFSFDEGNGIQRGFGHSLIKQLVERKMKGKVENWNDKGAIWKITIPLEKMESEDKGQEPSVYDKITKMLDKLPSRLRIGS